MTDVNRLDRHIPLEDRVWRALRSVCESHHTDSPFNCPFCEKRRVVVLQAFSWELDLLQRHDAIVETVVRDRIIESKKAEAAAWDLEIAVKRLRHWKSRAERYRLAWLSAKCGRRSWKNLYLGTIDPHRHDPLGLRFLDIARKHSRTIRELVGEMADLRLAFSEMEGQRAAEDRQTP